METPQLHIHAGFPKCATTTVQQLLSAEDFALCRALDLVWIGKGMVPWAAGPPVSEIMYAPDAACAALQEMPLDAGARYVLSSEALANNFDVLVPALARFDLREISLTIRLPLAARISEYCFSGWLTMTAGEVSLGQAMDPRSAVFAQLGQYAPVWVCPIEASGFVSRYFARFGRALPADPEAQAARMGSSNPSMPPALAAVMAGMLRDRLTGPVPGPLRTVFAQMGRLYQGKPEFAQAMPAAFAAQMAAPGFLARALEVYRESLALGGVPADLMDAALAASRARIGALIERPAPTAELTAAMERHGDWVLRKVQEGRPDVQALFKPEFQRCA